MDDKGQISYVFVFLFVAVLLLVIFAVLSPLMQNFSTQTYLAGEMLITDANEYVENIQDDGVKASLLQTFQAQKEATPTNIEILGLFFQYGWLVIILAILAIIFIAARKTVEREVF